MKGNSSGVTFEDRELAGKVRRLTLLQIEKILKKGKGSLYGAVIVRLAGTILPRLNEITGEDGGPLQVEISEMIAKKHAANKGAK